MYRIMMIKAIPVSEGRSQFMNSESKNTRRGEKKKKTKLGEITATERTSQNNV